MLTDYEIYKRVDAMLPAEVDRELSETAISCGEPESAIATLISFASEDGLLTDKVIELLSSEYEHGVVALTLGAIVDAMKQDAA
ncbi:Uncharacterised protein [Corynebacterium kutscheri]|uniref:Uncharacterized protein n=1 Tax=Corynebacterium kutscheri TaxID=35755 RepID=A0AB38VTC0_9CORY|nr:hypothetical protein [Corynebacterium kutscheri]VEH07008.1 Uncharacterised protein [Corynebacterium kutscheri]VEH79504.1 Uncharacterised protein [Corynebacterium kutscheri]